MELFPHINNVRINCNFTRNGQDMKNKILLFILVMVLTSGCAVRQISTEWQATGGSRGDATVKLSYQYGYGAMPQLSEQQAISMAKKRCKAWGYTGAEAFGGIITVCNQRDPYLGCIDNFVTKEYQCIGLGDVNNSEL